MKGLVTIFLGETYRLVIDRETGCYRTARRDRYGWVQEPLPPEAQQFGQNLATFLSRKG